MLHEEDVHEKKTNQLLTSDRKCQLVGLFGGELQFQHMRSCYFIMQQRRTSVVVGGEIIVRQIQKAKGESKADPIPAQKHQSPPSSTTRESAGVCNASLPRRENEQEPRK
jgi:hypothetical protein